MNFIPATVNQTDHSMTNNTTLSTPKLQALDIASGYSILKEGSSETWTSRKRTSVNEPNDWFRFHSYSSESDCDGCDHHRWDHVDHCHLSIPVSWFSIRFSRVKVVGSSEKRSEVMRWLLIIFHRFQRARDASLSSSSSIDEGPRTFQMTDSSSFIASHPYRSAWVLV